MTYKIGTIFEIETPKGFAYAQYTHRDEERGYLIRVMRGLYETKQSDLVMLANKPTLFSTLIGSLQTAVRAKSFIRMGHQPVPHFAEKLPIFKIGYGHPQTGKIDTWTFVEGEKSWRKKAEELTDEEKDYPLCCYKSFDWLQEDIVKQWTPARDFE